MKKTYSVTITETLEKVVDVEASCREEAGSIAKMDYHNGDPVLDADNFTGVTFSAQEKDNMKEGQAEKMIYEFSFTEINYGSISIESDAKPTKADVTEAIMNGNAFYSDTEYKNIRPCGPTPQKSKSVPNMSR